MKSIYILDYETVSPIGIGKDALYAGLRANASGASMISRFSTEGLPVQIGAEIKHPLDAYLSEYPDNIRKTCHFDRKLEMLLACFSLFRPRLQTLLKDHDPARAGVILGLGLDITPVELLSGHLKNLSSPHELARILAEMNRSGREGANTISNPIDVASIILARELRFAAFQKCVLTACSASSQAVAFSLDSLRRGETDLVLTGGADSLLNLLGLIAFSKLGIIAPSDEAPDQVCKPLDKNRNSVLLGEGAGLMLLASEDFVRARRLSPRLELLGYGNTLDGYKITAPDPSATGMRQAMSEALRASQLKPQDIDYINLHGTGTMANDSLELKAIQEVFGEWAPGVAVSSTKDRHGHLIAGAGILELCLLAVCMENNFIPCTRNLKKPILEKEIDLVKTENRAEKIRTALSNSFAFGGVNTCLALRNLQ